MSEKGPLYLPIYESLSCPLAPECSHFHVHASGLIHTHDVHTPVRPSVVPTCRSIARHISYYGVEDLDREATLLGDAEEYMKKVRVDRRPTPISHALPLPHTLLLPSWRTSST